MARAEIDPTSDLPTVAVQDAPDSPPPGTMPGKKGCLLALGLGAVFGLGSIGLSGVLFEKTNSARLRATNDLASIVDRGQVAPGADAVRTRGCVKAAVLPAVDIAAIAQDLEDAEAKKKGRPARRVDTGNDPVVYCAVESGAQPLTCHDVAVVYVEAAGPSGSFVVTMRPPGAQGCAERFGADGASLGDAPPPNVPEL